MGACTFWHSEQTILLFCVLQLHVHPTIPTACPLTLNLTLLFNAERWEELVHEIMCIICSYIVKKKWQHLLWAKNSPSLSSSSSVVALNFNLLQMEAPWTSVTSASLVCNLVLSRYVSLYIRSSNGCLWSRGIQKQSIFFKSQKCLCMNILLPAHPQYIMWISNFSTTAT